jgi:hypothetical protein
MVNKIAITALCCLFMTVGPQAARAANSTGKPDSTISAAKTAPAEEILNLDDTGSVLAPAKKTTPAPAAVPPTPAAPVAAQATTPAPAAPTPAPAAPPSSASSPAAPAAGTAQKAVKDSSQKSVDEDLILEGGEEDLLDQAKVASKKAAQAKKIAADSTRGAGQPQAAQPATAGTGTPGAPAIPTPASLTVPNNAAAAPAAEPAVPTTIENAHSLNFANNLRQYRSPKLAMLMSLILPGSGEIYAQSNIWAAGFVVVEAALLTGGISLAKTAAVKKQAAHTYADQHYSVDSMKQYDSLLHKYLATANPNMSQQGIDSLYYQQIFTDSENVKFFQQAGNKSDAFYSLINSGQSSPFIRGWDDVTPSVFTANGFQQPFDTMKYSVKTGTIPDSSYFLQLKSDSSLLFGQSAHQEIYNGMVQNSLKWSNYSRDVFLTLIVNHLASALAAGILAKKHNDELLGQQSFWSHIGVDVAYVNTGSQTVPAYALQVRF